MDPDELKKLTLEQVALLAGGYCPWCEEFIRGHEYHVGTWSHSKNLGIDPYSGHRESCAHRDVEIP